MRIFWAIFLAAVMVAHAVAPEWEYINLDVPPGAKESVWRDALAKQWNGRTEVRIEGGRIDVLTDTLAIEIDWQHKWHEGLGQAIHYADATGKTGVLALISHSSGPDQMQKRSEERFNMVNNLCRKKGIRMVVLFRREKAQ